MSKSDLLKDSMKGGLDGLLSPTKKTTGGKQPVADPHGKRNGGSLQLRHQQKHSYPYEIPRHQEEHVAERHRERGNERVSGEERTINTGMATASAHPGDGSHASFFIRPLFP